jgi:pimeloyl-ACP methyl ester carboxylesterase
MQELFLKERGIYYRTNQFVNGRKTLVFVHGLSGSSSAWKDYETRFGNDYNILTFDLRGHGKSLKPKLYKDYKIGEFVLDIKSLIDFLHIETCVLLGHSFGAAVALEFLLTYPEKVSEVIFLAPDFYTKGIRLTRLVFPLIGLSASVLRFFPFLKQTGSTFLEMYFGKSGSMSKVVELNSFNFLVKMFWMLQVVRIFHSYKICSFLEMIASCFVHVFWLGMRESSHFIL